MKTLCRQRYKIAKSVCLGKVCSNVAERQACCVPGNVHGSVWCACSNAGRQKTGTGVQGCPCRHCRHWGAQQSQRQARWVARRAGRQVCICRSGTGRNVISVWQVQSRPCPEGKTAQGVHKCVKNKKVKVGVGACSV